MFLNVHRAKKWGGNYICSPHHFEKWEANPPLPPPPLSTPLIILGKYCAHNYNLMK